LRHQNDKDLIQVADQTSRAFQSLKEGVATVQITIDLFDNFFPVTFGWTKECSTIQRSNQPALLNVGLGVVELNSVAINNTPRTEWDPESPITVCILLRIITSSHHHIIKSSNHQIITFFG